jgi:hypothetical protein
MQESFDHLCLIYPFHVGKAVSAREREKEFGVSDDLLHVNTSFTYGETSLSTISRLLEVVENHRLLSKEDGCLEDKQRREVFLDVGSGVGKPVFAAALVRPWSLCVGIELLRGLHEIALEMHSHWRGGLPYVERGVKGTLYRIPSSARRSRILFRCGDITDENVMRVRQRREERDNNDDDDDNDDDNDVAELSLEGGTESLWDLVDVAYACSTCFDEPTVIKLAQAAMRMRPGTIFATSGVHLPATWGKLIETIPETNMSWGQCEVFVYKRY